MTDTYVLLVSYTDFIIAYEVQWFSVQNVLFIFSALCIHSTGTLQVGDLLYVQMDIIWYGFVQVFRTQAVFGHVMKACRSYIERHRAALVNVSWIFTT